MEKYQAVLAAGGSGMVLYDNIPGEWVRLCVMNGVSTSPFRYPQHSAACMNRAPHWTGLAVCSAAVQAVFCNPYMMQHRTSTALRMKLYRHRQVQSQGARDSDQGTGAAQSAAIV